MYKFIIADDDRLVRERILSAIPTEKLGLELCGEAEDGVQTLELFDRYHPQIVIMDINMPLINGIEVAKQILTEDGDVNVIIVTGYGTVDFAQEAIRGGVVDFLLKPIDFKELKQVLEKIVNKLKEKASQTLDRQRMERLLERGMPLLRNKYFLSLMQTSAENLTEEECRQYLHDFGIVETPNSICVAIIVPNYGGMAVNEQMSMQAVLEEELIELLRSVEIGCIVIYDSMQRAVLVAYSTKKLLAFTLEQKISVIRDKMRYLYRLDFRASIGNTVLGFHQLQESYQNAEHALGYWTILGDNNIVSSDNVNRIDIPASKLPNMRYSDLMNLLVAADESKLQNTLTSYLNELVYSSRISISGLQLRAVELVSLMDSCSRELGEGIEVSFDKKPLVYVRILNSNSVHEIINIVQSIATKIVSNICGQREESRSRALSGAKRFIMQNYSNSELNLTQVAEHVNLSPSYVSQLFKRIDNCTFTEYLNSVRIEQAKKLLSITHMRVYEVADAVGYQNSKYFFQVFKQITGKRPREFYNASSTEESS